METVSLEALGLQFDGSHVILTQPIDTDGNFVMIKISREQVPAVVSYMLKATKTRKSNLEEGTAVHFPDFWTLYPAKRRDSKDACLAKWKKHGYDSVADSICGYIIEKKRSDWAATSQQPEGQYAPNATTFLNQRRWENEEVGSQIAAPSV